MRKTIAGEFNLHKKKEGNYQQVRHENPGVRTIIENESTGVLSMLRHDTLQVFNVQEKILMRSK